MVVHGHQLRREIHGSIGGQERSVLQHAKRCVKVEPQVIGRKAHNLRRFRKHHVKDTLQALCQRGKIEGLAVRRPHGAVGIVLEGRCHVANVLHHGILALALPFFRIADRCHHEADFVGLIAVAFHGQPGQLAAVRTPDGMRVVAARGGYLRGLSRERTVDVDAGVGREGVLLPRQLFAGIGNISAVRAPAKVCHIRERAVGQLEKGLIFSQDIQALTDNAIPQRCHKAVRNVRHPVVPVPVHQVLRGIGFRLGKQRIRICGHLYGAVHIGHVNELGLVRRQEIIVHAGGNVRQLRAPAQLAAFERSFVQLSALEEVDGAAVLAPPGRCNAFAVHGELRGFAAIGRHHKEVAHAAVFRNGGVTDAIQDGFSVRRELRVAQAPQREQELRGHVPAFHLQGRGAYVRFVRFHFRVVTGSEGQHRGHHC